ncbi:MgtC/SapB family protein [Pseudoalteromonas sp. S16_S37]|uniref:MgtC/SapB family protein n=1 Tax=Pseudoalteromonas sp. S16_S37 TaxID=2720228 RepID=UPI001681A252|nr:MgtC/SapB family protein [Pseudoalteromonas sp. S16_S37]MBD1583004.1 MgtC/SapB family protein [Pseudoalteromonas sp. S16_S37]
MDLATLFSIAPLRWPDIGAAILAGTIVGLERQLRGKPVGIRTSSLIVLGTYAFIMLSIQVNNEVADPSRIIGQVVTGIGFLGAGVMLSKEGVVVGVTSASTIWMLAAIGVSIAVVGPLVAIKLAVIVVGILYGVDILESSFTNLTRGVHGKYTGWKTRTKKDANK